MAPTLLLQEPLFRHAPSSGFQNLREDTDTMMMDDSGGGLECSMLTMELKNKILTFRDIIELPSYNNLNDLTRLAVRTIADLHKLYPNMGRVDLSTAVHKDSVAQCLIHLYIALKSVGKLWGLTDSMDEAQESLQNIEFDLLVGKVMAKLKILTTSAKEMFGVMDEDMGSENIESCRKFHNMLSAIYSGNDAYSPYPDALTSIPPKSKPAGNLEQLNTFPHMPEQNSVIVHEVSETATQITATHQLEEEPKKVSFEGLKEHYETKNDNQEITKHESTVEPEATHPAAILPPPAPPPPPPRPNESLSSSPSIPTSLGSEAMPPMPPSPTALTKGAPPPPPPSPLNMVKIVRLKRAASKLRRSSQMSALYRLLKGKVEGSSLKVGNGTSQQIKPKIGASPTGKEGMAEALTEITKRSSYFKNIEEDVVKYEQLILELKAAITSFQTKNMDDLIKFHKHVEQNLEKLTDETQLLSRFKSFPMRKLESLRAAAALYLKLNGILTDLQNWKIMPPVEQLLNKVESYFNKIKGELDALERTKDDDAKNFQSNNIHFNFGILANIKESMVDVSSSCMELALKEVRETAGSDAESRSKNQGGQDDRADRLSAEVAHEIEIDAQ